MTKEFKLGDNLIQIEDDFYVVVDNQKCKGGDWELIDGQINLVSDDVEDANCKIIATIGKRIGQECTCGNDKHSCKYYNYENKCTRTIDNLPLIEIPDEWLIEFNKSFPNQQNVQERDLWNLKDGFMEGYKAAQRGTYTEEDMIGFNLWSSDSSWVRRPDGKWVNLIMGEKEQKIATDTELIRLYQSLQKKKVIKSVVLEMEEWNNGSVDFHNMKMNTSQRIKITNTETNTITSVNVIYE